MEEDVIIATLNSLQLENALTSLDIDISHPLPSKRRDNKSVSGVSY